MSDIMAAGFSSTNRSIVNSTVVMWNEKFGELESLEYPANVEAVLRQLRQAVDIELPTFPNESKDTVSVSSNAPRANTNVARIHHSDCRI